MKMKNIYKIALAAALLAPTAALAEEVQATDGKIAFGLQGGATFPEFKVKNSSISNTWDRKDGWMAGVFFEFGIWTITLRPEVNFERKGYTIANVTDVENDYLNLNALLKFSPFGDGVFSPYILVGPGWSKQMKSRVTPKAGATVVFTNNTDQWDIAGVAGLGFDFNVSENIALGIQGRYVLGFRDVDSSTTEVKQREFNALANLTFQNAF